MEILIPEPFEMMFKPKRYKVWKGGRGGAKSESIARGLLILADMPLQVKQDLDILHPEQMRILCFREIQNSIKDSVKRLLEDVISDYQMRNYRILNDAIYNKKTGSDFLFKGLKSNIDSIKSLKGVNIAWGEEGQNISKDSLTKLKSTIREPYSEIWFSYNPEFDDDPVTKEFPGSDSETDVRHINYDENPFFSEILENERLRDQKLKPEEYAWIWLGATKNQGVGTVVRNFTDDNIKPVFYQSKMDLHISCDFNVDPMAWVLAHISYKQNAKSEYILDDYGNKIPEKVFYFDEIMIENTNTLDCINEFYSRYPDHKGKIIINGDASGDNRSTQSEFTNYATIENRLKQLGYKDVKIQIKSFNPPIKNRIAAWNSRVVDYEDNRNIIIDPKCKWLLYNCRRLKYKVGSSLVDTPSRPQILKNNELKFLEHPFDAASYLIDYYWPVKLD